MGVALITKNATDFHLSLFWRHYFSVFAFFKFSQLNDSWKSCILNLIVLWADDLVEGNQEQLASLTDWTKVDTYCVCVVTVASGPCDFQNGLCGLRKDVNSEFQWRTNMGATLSENTGPSFDHTTLSSQGKLLRSFDLKLWKNIWHFRLVFHR